MTVGAGERLCLGVEVPAQQPAERAEDRHDAAVTRSGHGDAALALAGLRRLVADDDRADNDTVERDLHDGAGRIAAHGQADDLAGDGGGQLEHDHGLRVLRRRRCRAVVERIRALRLGARGSRAEKTGQRDEGAEDPDGADACVLGSQLAPVLSPTDSPINGRRVLKDNNHC